MRGEAGLVMENLSIIQKEIIRFLQIKRATYAQPVNSEKIGGYLNVTPSYVREQAKRLEKKGVIAVRRGPGGGYFYLYDRLEG